jgi:hypothetical protein
MSTQRVDLAAWRRICDAANSLEDEVRQDDRFGLCPHCHRTDGFLNAGRNHWFYCEQHRVAWCGGSNLFSCWKDESETEQRRKFAKIEQYRDIEPFYWNSTGGRAA